ncbi:hypothetical protein GE09DRAFT_1257060 [Coniochaeta sp. 2T2.1]|nr:hypothetical protein GE09DRAFT_1257060 [Coniochaeta sp. 2T2.1]
MSSLGLLPPTSVDSLLPQLAMGNMVPLFLGGRTNPLAYLVRMDRGDYYRVHRWAALVALGEGVAHAVMAWPEADRSQRLSGSLLIGGIVVGCMTPLVLMLRSGWLFVFPKLHLGASLAAVGALVLHIWARHSSSFDAPWILLCCGGSLWAISTLVRIVRGWRHGGDAEAWSVGKRDTEYEAVRVKVQLRHPVATRPGNYFYLFLPGLRNRLQSHAAPVAWWDPSERKESRNVTFLLEKRWASRLLQRPTPVMDGPYGRDFGFERYPKVVLLADGIGIAGVLPFAVSMISRKHFQWEAGGAIDKTHKLFLFWELDDPSQGEWVMDLFDDLHKVDVTKAYTCARLYTDGEVGLPETLKEAKNWGVRPRKDLASLGSTLTAELLAPHRPGKSIILVCGKTAFKKRVAERLPRDPSICYRELDYQPET